MRIILYKELKISHCFVEFIPEKLEENIIYISIEYATATHKCFCGCGLEVVTPFTPTDWKLIFDGVSISLYPSIGNWSFPCKSHYWLENNTVYWSEKWSKAKIKMGREKDKRLKNVFFTKKE